jgi:hypothetical protein
MQQKSGDHWRPLGFFARKLTDTESCYSTFDPKLLAAHAAIKHFRHFCEGRDFNFGQNTNHLLLPFPAFQPPFRPDNNAVWHSSQNLMCNCCICLKNVVAHFLSRPNQTTPGSVTATSAVDPVDFEEMATGQNRCRKRSTS